MFLFEARFKAKSIEKDCLIVFSGQLEGDGNEYSYLLERNLSDFRDRPEELLFIFPDYIRSQVIALFQEGGRPYNNITRYGDLTKVSLLSFDIDGKLFIVTEIGRSSVNQQLDQLSRFVVEEGLLHLASKRKDQVVMRAPSGTVFIKPSGAEYDEFIRASELVVGYSENQFVAYCLLTKSPQNKGQLELIYIDTNSISSYAEAVIYYLCKFQNSICKQVKYRSFGSYEGKDGAKPENPTNVWLIISASASNNMGIRMAKEWRLNNDQVITILSYTDTKSGNIGDKILVNICKFSRMSAHENNNGTLVKVKVVGENFTAEIGSPNPVLLVADHKTNAVSNLIFPNYSNDCFQSNKRVSSEYLPLAIHLDSTELITTTDFIVWLNCILDWYVPPKTGWLVTKRDDPASIKLTELIETALRKNNITNYKKLDFNDALDQISGNEAVIVAIPVVGTGQLLLNLNRNLRLSGHDGNRIFITPYVVAPSKTTFDKFKSSLMYAPHGMKYIHYSYRVAYVGSLDEQNSWGAELRIVEQFDLDFWKKRAVRLRNLSKGLEGHIGTPSINADEKLEFSQDFAFWGKGYSANDINPTAVYFTIASILQNLRETPVTSTGRDSLFSVSVQPPHLSTRPFML